MHFSKKGQSDCGLMIGVAGIVVPTTKPTIYLVQYLPRENMC